MNEKELCELVKRALHRIAPEVDLDAIDGKADLREEIDLDSMDLLTFFLALHEQLKIEIPEADYGRMTTLDGCVQYLSEKTGAA